MTKPRTELSIDPPTADPIDAAKKAFIAIKREIDAGTLNVDTEADTRLKVIDRVLNDVLLWPLSHVKTEHKTSNGYSDYLLQDTNGRNVCVLEAKRAGKLIADTVREERIYTRLGSAYLKPGADGIAHAISYSSASGVTFAILTNGSAWIFFRSVRTDGLPPQEGRCVLFASLAAIEENFAEFFELACFAHIERHLYRARLDQADGLTIAQNEPRYFVTPKSDIKMMRKSPFHHEIENVFSSFFARMSSQDDREMLKRCFVETKESKDAEIALTKVAENLIDRTALLETVAGEELQREIEHAATTHVGEVVLIVGNKGAGKSTFIERFFDIVLAPTLRRRCLHIRVDLAGSSGNLNGLQDWLTRELCIVIEKQFFDNSDPNYDELRGIFFSVYQRWSKGEFKPLYETDKTAFQVKFGEYMHNLREQKSMIYVIALLQNAIHSRKLMPCLVLDNSDNFSPEFQQQVFQFAQAIYRSVFAFIILPITDRTIWQLSKAGPLQSYVAKTFSLPVPAMTEVLEKRVAYIREKIEEEKAVPGTYFTGRGLRIREVAPVV